MSRHSPIRGMKVSEKRFDIGILSLLLLFALFLLVVSPVHEFPLNDDWSYALPVKNLYEIGSLKILDWSAASALFHILWGWSFVLPFGFSFTILRISTLTLHLMGTIILYKLLRDMGGAITWSLFSTLIFVFNPWVFQLSYSFMTDVPFLSFTILALYFYHRGLFGGKIIFLWLGSAAASISFLIREMGILLPISVVIYLFIWDRKTITKRTLAIVSLPIITLVCFEYWYVLVHGVTKGHTFHRNTMINNLMSPRIVIQCFERCLNLAFFLGLSLLPLSMAISVSLRDKLRHSSLRRKISLVLLTALLVWVAIGKAGKSDSYPIDYLWIAASFLGVMSGVKPPVIPVGWEKVLFWISVTSTCVIFAWLFLEFFKREDSERRSPPFFVLLGAVQIGYVVIAPFFFQRYFLPVIPMIILYSSDLIRGNRVARNPVVLSFLIVPALFSVLSTKDSLSWNQAKWHAAQGLIKQGISAKHIEAGIEWDGWNWYECSKKHPDEKPQRYYPVPWWLFDLTPVIDPTYVVSFSRLEGYEMFNSQRYYSPFFQKEQALLILFKSPPKVVEGFETDKDFTTGWNHNLENNVLSRNQKTDFVSEGGSSLKCEFKTSAKDTFHYGGMRVTTPMKTPGFIFDIWIDNPENIKKVFVYCYDNGGNLTGMWSRDTLKVPIKRRELNTFFFLFGLSQDSFQFGGGSGGKTEYVDVFVESEKENVTIIFYIDNFCT